MIESRCFHAVLLLAFLCAHRLPAGAYSIVSCTGNDGCHRKTLAEDPNTTIAEHAIVHALGYDGSGGSIEIKVCSGAPELVGPTERAIITWNNRIRQTQNCQGCIGRNDVLPTTGEFHAESTIIHELGHCAFGLGHINRLWDDDDDGMYTFSYWTMSADALGISDGGDGVHGSGDDVHSGVLGNPADSVSWYRRSDNNTVIVDGTVIDIDTFSRSPTQLPGDDHWAASANIDVAVLLGQPDTQSVMFDRARLNQNYLGLSSDDVNMLAMAAAGADLQTETTPDNYGVGLVYTEDCDEADIVAQMSFNLDEADVGFCSHGGIARSFEQTDIFKWHHTLQISSDGPQRGLPQQGPLLGVRWS